MDRRLALLIEDYQETVVKAITVLERAGIRRPPSNTQWAGISLPNGDLLPGYRIFKHGFGCSVKGPGLAVDFDFGNAGQIDGFDIGRLQAFATRRPDLFGVASFDEIRRTLAEATEGGEITVDTDGKSYVAG
jgi:hypothetical protein